MKVNEAALTDAISVYALAVAYLLEGTFDIETVANTMRIMEVSPGVFYFWQREWCNRHQATLLPDAICIRDKKGSRWQVKLGDEEVLTLVDKGSVWEPVKRRRPRKKPIA